MLLLNTRLELRKAQQIVFCSRIRLCLYVFVACCASLVRHIYLPATHLHIKTVVAFFQVFDHLWDSEFKHFLPCGTPHVGNMIHCARNVGFTNMSNSVHNTKMFCLILLLTNIIPLATTVTEYDYLSPLVSIRLILSVNS